MSNIADAHGWMPIETVPKDGTWVHLWRTPSEGPWEWDPMITAFWCEEYEEFVWPDVCDPYTEHGRAKALEAVEKAYSADASSFTHWRPLMLPPVTGA